MMMTLNNVRLSEKGKPQAFNGKSYFEKTSEGDSCFHILILNKILTKLNKIQIEAVICFALENLTPFSIQES